MADHKRNYGPAAGFFDYKDRFRHGHYYPVRDLVYYKGKWIPLEEYNRLPPDDADHDLS